MVRPDPTLEASTQSSVGECATPDPASGTDVGVSLAEYRALLAEVEQLRSQEKKHTERIQDLEQALDQERTSSDEMRLKLEGQRLLEAQLVATEKFACVQQQAIARLRLRIQQQQRIIDRHLNEVREASRSSEWLAASPEEDSEDTPPPSPKDDAQALTAAMLETCRQQIADLEAASARERDLSQRLQNRLVEAQQKVQELALTLDGQGADAPPDTDLSAGSTGGKRSARSPKRPSRQPHRAVANLGRDLARTQIKVEELEIELSRQLRQQALWQQRSQENQSQVEHYRDRLHQLEHQTAEMQEQIVYQARQVSEYEATIQHWKDQYATSQSQLTRLQELIEEVQLQFLTGERDDPSLSALFSELLAVVEFATLPGETDPNILSNRSGVPFNKLDLPDFLLRRRSYRLP